MFRPSLFSLVALGSALVALSGCNFPLPSGQTTQPLVVDLTAVARALGRDEAMQQKLQTAQQQLNAQLKQIGSDLQTQLQDQESKLAGEKKKVRQETLEKLSQQANLQLRQSRLIAERKADRYRLKLIDGFRNEVRQVAKSLSEKRGAQSVFINDGSLLWYSPAIDITDEVIAALRAADSAGPETAESETGARRHLEELNELMDKIETRKKDNTKQTDPAD